MFGSIDDGFLGLVRCCEDYQDTRLSMNLTNGRFFPLSVGLLTDSQTHVSLLPGRVEQTAVKKNGNFVKGEPFLAKIEELLC